MERKLKIKDEEMSDWTVLHEGRINDRPVRISRYLTDDYRVSTTLSEDYQGKVEIVDGQTLMTPYSEKGTEIDIDFTLSNYETVLAAEKFSPDEIAQIKGMIDSKDE